MINLRALELTDSLIRDYQVFTSKRYDKLKDGKYYGIYGDWDSKTWYNLKKLFFNLVTGEPDFERFYSRFEAPACDHGLKPIVWGPRFLPDMICDDIFDPELDLADKVKNVKKLYDKCVKLEKKFRRKK